MTAAGPSTRQLLPIATPARTRAAVSGLLRGRGVQLAVTFGILLLAAVAIVTVPPLLGRIVDLVIDQGERGQLVVLAGLLLAALVVRAVLAGIGHVLVARLGEHVLAGLRERVVRRALGAPIEVIERAGPGDLVQRTGGDVAVISEGIRMALPALMISLLDVLMTLLGLTVLDWRLGLAGLAPLPIWVLATRWYMRTSGPMYAAERVAEGAETGSLVDTLGGADTVRAYRVQARHLDRVRDSTAGAVTATMRTRTMQARFGAVLNTAEGVGVVSLLVVGFLLVRSDAITIGAATAAALYFLRLFSPLMELLYLLDEAQSATAALARLVGVTDLPAPTITEHPVIPRDASVSLRGIRHAYDDGVEVLGGIDLEVSSGERIAVVGTSGAGKTTLGSLVAGVRRPVAGSVAIGGAHLEDLADLRRHVVLVAQEVHVFSGTVADNLRLARPSATDDELKTVLGQLGVRLEIDDELGDGTDEVTATNAQLLALARVQLADPDVVVLDEATAEAGSAGARTLETAAEVVLAGRTAIVIAHRLTQAVVADRVVVMDDGHVVETGTHDELVEARGRYAALWSAWREPR